MKKQGPVKENKKQKVETVENKEILKLKAQLVRALADYDNLRKRTEEERLTWIKFATGKFIQNILPILDNFENAQMHLKDQGLAIAISQFKELLKSEGLIEIKPNQNESFDENLHEALETVEGSDKSGKIAETVLPGWKFIDGRVIRHAKVKVYK